MQFFCVSCLSNKLIFALRSCIYFETVFEWFCLEINSKAKYLFSSSPKHWDQGLIVVTVYYFQIWKKKKKEQNIIIRVISNHMGSMYIETPSLYLSIYGPFHPLI